MAKDKAGGKTETGSNDTPDPARNRWGSTPADEISMAADRIPSPLGNYPTVQDAVAGVADELQIPNPLDK